MCQCYGIIRYFEWIVSVLLRLMDDSQQLIILNHEDTMKKMLSFVAAAISAATVTMAYADTPKNNDYYSSMRPGAGSASLMVPITNITVINMSDRFIYVTVPNTTISDMVYTGKSDTISNDSTGYDTHLVLLDSYHATFFDQFVCRRAVVMVDGTSGNFHINVDRRYC